MFPLIPLIVAFAGSIYAAIWDLRTTEIPDEIPHAMIVFALIFYAIQSVIENNYWIFLNSLIAGGVIFALGFAMYYAGQWGGGDAKVLAAVIFLLPLGFGNTILPFPVTYLLNVFIVGAAYMMLYSLAIAFMNRKIFSVFFKDVRKNKAVFAFGSASLFAAVFLINYFIVGLLASPINYFSIVQYSIVPVLAAIGLYIVWRFAKAVEDIGFKRKIPISKLRIGDVLIDSKVWEGITAKQLKKIKRSEKRFVWIKEGVRFAPAFPLALLFTLIYGDFLFLFLHLAV